MKYKKVSDKINKIKNMRRENDNTFYKKVVALATKILHLKNIKKMTKKVLTLNYLCGNIRMYEITSENHIYFYI